MRQKEIYRRLMLTACQGWRLDHIHLSAIAGQDGVHHYQGYIEQDLSSNGSPTQLMKEAFRYG